MHESNLSPTTAITVGLNHYNFSLVNFCVSQRVPPCHGGSGAGLEPGAGRAGRAASPEPGARVQRGGGPSRAAGLRHDGLFCAHVLCGRHQQRQTLYQRVRCGL